MKGYKVFNSDWTCQDFQYEVGETYEIDEKPIICKRGFHFCQKLKDCFYYYPFHKDVKIAEVEALGDIRRHSVGTTTKRCTNKIKIIREIRFEDLMPVLEFKSGVFSSGALYEPGTLDLGTKRAVCINCEIALNGIFQVLDRKLNNCFAPYIYTYHVNFTAITDVKEKPHEL